MALIIKCKQCSARSKNDSPCPKCGSTERVYTVDYRADGRYSQRIRERLPEDIQDLASAKSLERLILETRNKVPKPAYADALQTVDELFPDYLAWYKIRRSPNTYKDIRLVFDTHLSRILGKEKVESLNNSHINYYQQIRHAEKVRIRGREKDKEKKEAENKDRRTVSNRTINKELDYFRGFLRWCRTEKGIETEIRNISDLPYNSPLPDILAPEEIRAMIDNANPFYRALILCLYTLGLRISEATGIKLNDIDWQNNTVTVRQKGGDYKRLPIGKALLSAFKILIEQKVDVKSQREYIFCNPKTGEPIVNVRPALKKLAKAAGIKKNVHPHTFRHCCATHLMGKGLGTRIIQGHMGHAGIETTEIYTHLVMTHLQGAAEIMDGLIGLSTDSID